MNGFYFTTCQYNSDILHRKYKVLSARGTTVTEKNIGNITMISSRYNMIGMYNDTNIYIVGDGNIYNNKALGYHCSMPAMISSLYTKYETNLVTLLNGKFSFVIYDKAKHLVYGARDRLGETPFFYKLTNGTLECSSSLKALCIGQQHDINPHARHMYMKYGFIYDSACIFADIHKLPAGHYFTYNTETHEFHLHQYWDQNWDFSEKFENIDNQDKTIDLITDLIDDAIRIRLPDDLHTGIGVSSGTDAFSIYMFLLKHNIDLQLFNIIPDQSHSSNEYSKACKHVHQVTPYKPINGYILTDNDYVQGFNDYFSYYDEPNSDFSCIITDILFKQMSATNSITTALSGIGADDIFYGKPRYGKFLDNINTYYMSESELENYCDEPLIITDFSELLSADNILTMQHYDIKTYLPNLLVKEDIASSHNSIDIRSPYCDYRLVELLNSLDKDIIYDGHNYKYLLKRIILNEFSVDFFAEKKKGFFPNLNRIKGIREITDDINDTVTPHTVSDFFPEININKLFKSGSALSIRTQLNLYAYIKMIEYYRSNIFT